MPYLMDTGARVAELTDAAIHLATTQGLAALTLRKLADVVRLSPATLISHLTSKRRIIHLITCDAGDRVVDLLDRRTGYRGLAGLVPDDEDLPLLRAWLGLVELTRTDGGTSSAVAAQGREIAAIIAWTRQPPWDPSTVDSLVAVTRGLWSARCAAHDPMSADRAREVLAHTVDALAPQTTESGSSC